MAKLQLYEPFFAGLPHRIAIFAVKGKGVTFAFQIPATIGTHGGDEFYAPIGRPTFKDRSIEILRKFRGNGSVQDGVMHFVVHIKGGVYDTEGIAYETLCEDCLAQHGAKPLLNQLFRFTIGQSRFHETAFGFRGDKSQL